ncbi:GcrA family cell cycle regulator [Rhizobium sp. NPDC090275]|uniref:GcrA family cell cycle regulator n=1 Tax=Rhizobium sp. NPDC090275 TaxID=3364498 RepID=UPI00383BE460
MSVSVDISWTDARVTAAAKLWNEGLSAAAIAERLGGITRSAVLGKVNRHPDLFAPRRESGQRAGRSARPAPKAAVTVPDVVKRTSSFGYQPSAPRARRPDPVPPVVQAMNIPNRPAGNYRHRDFRLDDSQTVPFSKVGRFQCAWPLTDFEDADTADMPCCGRPRRGGDAPDSSYCAEHAAISRGVA